MTFLALVIVPNGRPTHTRMFLTQHEHSQERVHQAAPSELHTCSRHRGRFTARRCGPCPAVGWPTAHSPPPWCSQLRTTPPAAVICFAQRRSRSASAAGEARADAVTIW